MPLPDKVAQQLYDQLNEMEAQMGSPMPPQVRASIHDDLEKHYGRMVSVKREGRRLIVALAACYIALGIGLGLITTLQGPEWRVVGPTLISAAFGAGVAFAVRIGQLHERHRMMRNVGVELHQITPD